MHNGDVITKTITANRKHSGSYLFTIERAWLEYLGFTDEEIRSCSIDLVFKAEVAERKKNPYIGFGKRRE